MTNDFGRRYQGHFIRLAIIVILGVALSALLFSSRVEAESARNLFEKVLVIGASVSNGKIARSPGHRVADAAGVKEQDIIKKAKDGVKSGVWSKWVRKNMALVKPSIVFGIDLFGHEVKTEPVLTNDVKKRVEEMLHFMCKNSKQVYIGNTVQINLGQASAQLNTYLAELKRTKYPNLHIVDIRSIFMALNTGSYEYNIDGKRFTVYRSQAMKDLLHPNSYGTKLLANVLIKQIRGVNPEITEKDLPYYDVAPATSSGGSSGGSNSGGVPTNPTANLLLELLKKLLKKG